MSARLDICNNSLLMIGADMITSLEDDAPEAKVMKSFYYNARDMVLEDANWTFATKRFVPALSATAPAFGWTSAFPIPSDIVRVTNVLREPFTAGFFYGNEFPEEYKVPHVVEGNEILCNESTIYCLGVRRMEDEGGYSPLFVEALTAFLAFKAALPIAQSSTSQQVMMGLYTDLLGKAKTRDGMQNSTRKMRNDTLRFSR